MATEVKVSGGTSISVTLNQNVLTTVETETSSVHVTQPASSQTVISTATVTTPLTVKTPAKNKISVTQQVTRSVDVLPQSPNQVTILAKGLKGDPGADGAPGPAGPAGSGIATLFDDDSPQLGANLDLLTRTLFTSVAETDITFTPTGSINLDGTVKFKRFTDVPDPFEVGMYADNNNNLYFGVSSE